MRINKQAPYGIRAGARKVGKKNSAYFKETKEVEIHHNNRIPQCIPYDVPDVLRDLLDFSARTLRVGGRLVYWLPTTDLYTDADLPLHPCMKIVGNSEQQLTMRWRRRLITMEKVNEYRKEYSNLPVCVYVVCWSLN